MKQYLLSILFFLVASGVSAQLITDTIRVKDQAGEWIEQPWTGGILAPMMGKIDVDMDGKKDLLLFMGGSDRVAVYLNKGGVGETDYRFSAQHANLLPAPYEWMVIADYNGDGKMDMFTYYPGGGTRVYKNTSTVEGGFSMELANDRLKSDENGGIIFASGADYPAIYDYDNDGDADYLICEPGGTWLYGYTNQSMERHGHADSLLLIQDIDCFGKFAEAAKTNEVTLYVDCDTVIGKPKETRHAGSSIVALDYNGDNLTDIILGDPAYNTLTYLENGGTVESSLFTSQDANFPSQSVSVNIDVFPSPFVLDLDNDGFDDFLVASSSYTAASHEDALWYFRNASTTEQMDFKMVTKNFLTDKILDLGSWSGATFADLDGDGKEDLVLNSKLKNVEGEGKGAQFELYLTKEDEQGVYFEYTEHNMIDTWDVELWGRLSPTFGDLDDDGDLDVLIGLTSGKIAFGRNTAGKGNLPVFELVTEKLANIDEDVDLSPQLFDLDKDGYLDLLFGVGYGGQIYYYRNLGKEDTLEFEFVTNNLGGVKLEGLTLTMNVQPYFFNNEEGNTELLIGNSLGEIHYYNHIDGNLDGNFNLIDSLWGGQDFGREIGVTSHDIDGDGKLEFVLSSYDGGFFLYQEEEPNSDGYFHTQKNFKIYPNPVDGQRIFMDLGEAFTASELLVRMSDLQGKTIFTTTIRPTSGGQAWLDLPGDLSKGAYLLSLEGFRSHLLMVEN